MRVVNGPTRQHLVSKGYQRNFATERGDLTIVDARSGRIVESCRPAARNWVEENWNSFWLDSGEIVHHLEIEFSKIEAGMLRRIREVDASQQDLPAFRAAVINLAAMHLVRSKSHRDLLQRISRTAIPDIAATTAADPEVRNRFESKYGRVPQEGELLAIVLEQAGRLGASKKVAVDTAIDQHNKMTDLLNPLVVQVIEIDAHLPGVPIGDEPIVRADLATNRFGFRDDLAVGDGHVILIPLTRRRLACLVKEAQPRLKIGNISQWRRLVNLQARAAISEVATHPDDALRIARVCSHPPKRLARHTPGGLVI